MFKFEFDSNYVYKSENATVFPTTVYPEGLTGLVLLSTVGDNNKHQKWDVFSDLSSEGTPRRYASTRIMLHRATNADGSHRESHFSILDLVGSDNNLVMVEHEPGFSAYEGTGTMWGEEGEFIIRIELIRLENHQVKFKRFMRKHESQDWKQYTKVLFTRVCENML
jgi:hypothetical protein